MLKKRDAAPADGKPRSVFTSRGPRNAEEIETCVAMLEDGPTWDAEHYALKRGDLVKVWVDLLSTGCGYIDIVENEAYVPRLERYKANNDSLHYKHFFCGVFFVYYTTLEFAQEIISCRSIPDIFLHFLQSMTAHTANPSLPRPALTAVQMQRGQNQEPEHGLYCFSSKAQHPAFGIADVIASPPQLMERLRRSPHQISGGLLHQAWMTNVVSEFEKYAFMQFGHKLLRPHPGNRKKPFHKKKYLFCLTNSRETSERLGIPANVTVNLDDERFLGNWYKLFFDGRRPEAGLNKKEQHTCFLIMLGYPSEQIAQVLATTVGSVNQYQNKAGQKLYDAGYHGVAAGFQQDGVSPKCSRETISKVIFDNPHEVRSYILPLYPWPVGVFLR